MLHSEKLFPPSRAQALERLQNFLPKAGRSYASSRNTDAGSGLRSNVSMLSPYLRYRVITEREVVAAVLQDHTPEQAEKFIQEVFWRTYWKGWLQQRPKVWSDFLAERDRDRARVEKNSGLTIALADAEAGRTGIDCFDDWTRELIQTGYLHNHARMWFASIWIFTLKLPWTLGADFFLRHLIDADPASNTLSWRWVAGIQTQGKTYLARADNISKFTDGRYQASNLANQLASEAVPIREEAPYPAQELNALKSPPNDSPVLVLIHAEDFQGFKALPNGLDVAGVVMAKTNRQHEDWPFGDKAAAFVEHAAQDTASEIKIVLKHDVQWIERLDADSIIQQCQALGVDQVVTPAAPIGPLHTAVQKITSQLAQENISLYRFRRDWDTHSWPLAKKGFFPFKKSIPKLIQAAELGSIQTTLPLK